MSKETSVKKKFKKGDRIYFVIEGVYKENEYVRLVTGDERKAYEKAEEIFRVLVKRYKDKLFLEYVRTNYDSSYLNVHKHVLLEDIEIEDELTYFDYLKMRNNDINFGDITRLFSIKINSNYPKKLNDWFISYVYSKEIRDQMHEISKQLLEKYKDVSADIVCNSMEVFNEILDLIKIEGISGREFGYKYLVDNNSIKWIYDCFIGKKRKEL